MKTHTFTKEEIFNDYWGRIRQTIPCFSEKDLIITKHGSLTFATANQHANVIFSAIQQLTDLTGTGFGLFLKDPLRIIPAMIGVLKTGNYFIPLDVNFPKSTLQSMIDTAEIKYLLTTQDYLGQIRSYFGDNLTVIKLDELNYEQAMVDPVVIYAPEDVVQIMFTSGSTGQPKGAIEDYRYLCRAIFNRIDINQYKRDDRILQLSRYTFSARHIHIFSALIIGFTICYYDLKQEGLAGLPDWIREQKINVYASTPTVFRSLVSIISPNDVFPSVKRVKLGAEKRYPKDIQRIRDHFPKAEQIRLGFASTETQSVATTLFPRDFDFGQEDLPSGKPRDDIDLLIWDENGNSLANGQEGEIVVHGDALARGYINNPQLTQERFIQDPLQPGWQYFKTGDLGKIRPDGQLVHLGRMDTMVKIKGIRIELDSIENHILSYPGIIQVASQAIEDASGNKKLVLYYVPEKGIHIPISDLRKYLAERLPRHHLPHFLIPLDELPLTDGGKVARARLPQPKLIRAELNNPYIPPTDDLEKKLVEIWEEQIGISGIGITDNFFEVGGDSLLAIVLLVKIEEAIGVSLPLRTMLDHGTIQQIASLIRDPQNPNLDILVTFNSGGNGLPVFLIPTGHGDVMGMRALALLLEGRQPVYGLQAVGIGGKSIYELSREETAARFVQAIRTVQPSGPYRLIGGSAGGLVAYETARILSEAGEAVNLLGMIDTPPPGPRHNARLNVRLRIQCQNLRSLSIKEYPEYIMVRLKGHFIQLARSKIFRKLFTIESLDAILGKLDIQKPGKAAHILYNPLPYSGDVVILKAKERAKDEYSDPFVGWRKYIKGDITVVEVDGTHGSVYNHPDVVGLAKAISAFL